MASDAERRGLNDRHEHLVPRLGPHAQTLHSLVGPRKCVQCRAALSVSVQTDVAEATPEQPKPGEGVKASMRRSMFNMMSLCSCLHHDGVSLWLSGPGSAAES